MGSLPVFGGARVRGRNCLPFASTWVHSQYLVGHMLEAELFAIRVLSGTTCGIWWGTC
jgi:hypothetical protein